MKLLLAEVRRSRGISKYQLSALTGISQSYLSELESGKRDNPCIKNVCKIAKALQCSLDDLVDMEGDK